MRSSLLERIFLIRCFFFLDEFLIYPSIASFKSSFIFPCGMKPYSFLAQLSSLYVGVHSSFPLYSTCMLFVTGIASSPSSLASSENVIRFFPLRLVSRYGSSQGSSNILLRSTARSSSLIKSVCVSS